jgi:hypothetical protein
MAKCDLLPILLENNRPAREPLQAYHSFTFTDAKPNELSSHCPIRNRYDLH